VITIADLRDHDAAIWAIMMGGIRTVASVAARAYLLVTSHGATPPQVSTTGMRIAPLTSPRCGGAAFTARW
jgi:hypothetical protein